MIRLVIADYFTEFATAVAAGIARHSGIEIVGVSGTGPEAVDMAHRLRPDVILMNDNLPIINGYEATRMIIQEGFVPVIVMSGEEERDFTSMFLRVMTARGVDLIGKPDMQRESVPASWIDLLVDKIRSLHRAHGMLKRLKEQLQAA